MSWNIGEHRYPQIATFWEVKESKNSYAVVSLSTSSKDKEKVWHNSNWGFCRFVGKAVEGLDDLKEKDRIVIKSGKIAKDVYTDKDGNKAYPKNEQITIFAWEKYVPEDREDGDMDTPPEVEEELPF